MLKVLIFLTIFSSTKAQSTYQRPISSACDNAMLTCSKQTLTTGKCRSLYRGILLNQNRNDEDNNCTANGEDFLYDVTTYYDPNGDGQSCVDEWNARRTDAFGLNEAYTTAEFNSFNQVCLDVSGLGASPGQDLRSQFLVNQINRAVTICDATNIRSLSSCFGLPMICKYWLRDVSACSNFPGYNDYRTLYEKFMLNMWTNDNNGDGTVQPAEIVKDLNDNYDTDNDGKVSAAEWRTRWTEFYGFSTEYADFVFAIQTAQLVDKTSFDITTPADSSAASGFPIFNLQNIITMCEATPSLYDTNNDCAQLSETCQVYYPDQAECAPLIGDNCGIPAYISCINGLTGSGGACASDGDPAQVTLEVARSNNRLSPTCVVPDGDQCNSALGLKLRVGLLPTAILFCIIKLQL